MVLVQWMAVCLVVSINTLAASAADSPKVVVKKLAQAIGEATIVGDYEMILDLTHSGVVEELGGRANAVEQMRLLAEQMTEKGLAIKSYKVGTPGDLLTESGNTFVVIPHILEMISPRGKIRAEFYLLGISQDAGKTWKFVDGAGLNDEDFRKRALPKFPARLTLPKAKKPEIVKEE